MLGCSRLDGHGLYGPKLELANEQSWVACEPRTRCSGTGIAHEIPSKSRPSLGINPEEIPSAAAVDPDRRRDQIGILACKSFRFRDQKKIFYFKK